MTSRPYPLIELFQANAETNIILTLGAGHSYLLTIPEARELYTKLTPILEQHSPALAEAGVGYEVEGE